LSGVRDYMAFARLGLEAMKKHSARVIARILVLPGHSSCSVEPALELLSEYREDVWVGVLDQYVPEHKAHLDPMLNRRPTQEEISKVVKLVAKYGFKNIETENEDFWIE